MLSENIVTLKILSYENFTFINYFHSLKKNTNNIWTSNWGKNKFEEGRRKKNRFSPGKWLMMADQAALVDSNGTKEPCSINSTQPAAATTSNENNDSTNNKRKTKQISLSDYFTKRRKMSTNTGMCQLYFSLFTVVSLFSTQSV